MLEAVPPNAGGRRLYPLQGHHTQVQTIDELLFVDGWQRNTPVCTFLKRLVPTF